MCELGVFLDNDLLKVDKILGLTFSKGTKRLGRIQYGVVQFKVFVLDGLFTTPVCSRRRSRFWLKNRSLFMTNKFKRKCLQKFYVSSKQEK